MSDIKEVKETKKPVIGIKPANNKGGRPRKYVAKTGVTKETRVPISGLRDKLTVEGKDPNFHYYFEEDTDETGHKIHKRILAGYQLVQSDEVIVGQSHVYKSSNVGSIVRVPSGASQYLYLMKIPKDWHEEDMRAQEAEIRLTEESIFQTTHGDGRYGKFEVESKRK